MKNFLTLLPLLVTLLAGCDKKEDIPKANPSAGNSNPSYAAETILPLAAADWTFGAGNVSSQSNTNNYQPTLIISTSNTSLSLPVGTTGITGLSSRTTSYSLGIAATTLQDTTSSGYWSSRIFSTPSLRVGKSLTLKARIRLENVQGKGVSLSLRGDKGSQTALLFRTTEGQIHLKGTADFTDYSVTMPYSSPVDYVLVYLTMLPQTTGKVTFSDVSIQIK